MPKGPRRESTLAVATCSSDCKVDQQTKPSGRAVDTAKTARAALGVRAHSGWAALVAVAGPVGSPTVIGRRRVELADPEVPRPVQPYHAAQKLDLKKAKRYIERFADRAKLLANRALREVIDGLREAGYEAVGCGVPIGGRRQAVTLEAALASHPMLHTAQGELFRNALISAGEECGLGVLSIRERELFEHGVRELGLSNDALRLRLDELGRPLGPPWGQDQKMAALAAWLTLAASESKPVGCES